ncbi:ROK family protein [Companilactobacillus formosensis]|uniref:ROK family protein n=1 Tax=Companilactobacillus formosensis TaxID=1617889 RepID=UPI000E653A9F|nr:ROK family protein [Companilactobacillus formosensis]
MKTYLAFDIGGTKLKYALINNQGQILKKYSENTINDSKSNFIKRLNEIVGQFQSQISGIGISVPGKVDSKTGQIHFGGSLPFLDGIQLSSVLNTSLPIHIENDAKAATLGEKWLGSLEEIDNGIMLVLGTAVGSGIVLNGQLLHGSDQQAGEVSFMSLGSLDMEHFSGSKCSAVAMIKDIGRHYQLKDIDDGKKVFELITAKKDFAKLRFEEFCRNVALLIHNMQVILDVNCFVIGGGISRQSIVATSIDKALIDLRETSLMVKKTFKKPDIISSRLFNEANLLGSISSFNVVKSN